MAVPDFEIHVLIGRRLEILPCPTAFAFQQVLKRN